MAVQSDLRFSFTVGEVSFEVVEFTLHEGLSESLPQYPNPPRDWNNDIPASGAWRSRCNGRPIWTVNRALRRKTA